MKRKERDGGLLPQHQRQEALLEHQTSEECPNNFPRLGPHQDAGHEIPASFGLGGYEDPVVIVGRVAHDTQPTLRLPFSVISKKHCEISPRGVLVDRSSNGTYVNGARLAKGRQVSLRSGDVISFYKPPEKGTPPIDYVYLARAKQNSPRGENLDAEIGARGYERREAEARREIAALRREKKAKDDAIEALSRECKRLSSTNESLDRLFAHGTALSAKIVDESAGEASRLLDLAKEAGELRLRDETAELLAECERLRSELDDARNENATVSTRLETQLELNADLKGQCRQAKLLVDSLTDQCRHVQKELEEICASHQQLDVLVEDDDDHSSTHSRVVLPPPPDFSSSIEPAVEEEKRADVASDVRNGSVFQQEAGIQDTQHLFG